MAVQLDLLVELAIGEAHKKPRRKKRKRFHCHGMMVFLEA
jgi:hypothetical protein